MRLTESLEVLPSVAANPVALKRSLPEVAYLFVAAAIFTFWINSAYWLHTYQLLNIHGVMDVVFLLSQTLLVWGVTTTVLLLFCWGISPSLCSRCCSPSVRPVLIFHSITKCT